MVNNFAELFFWYFKKDYYSVKSESGSLQSRGISEAHEIATGKIQVQSDFNEETGQPPVIGASTTQEVVIVISFTDFYCKIV